MTAYLPENFVPLEQLATLIRTSGSQRLIPYQVTPQGLQAGWIVAPDPQGLAAKWEEGILVLGARFLPQGSFRDDDEVGRWWPWQPAEPALPPLRYHDVQAQWRCSTLSPAILGYPAIFGLTPEEVLLTWCRDRSPVLQGLLDNVLRDLTQVNRILGA